MVSIPSPMATEPPPVTLTLHRLSGVGLGAWVRPIMLLLVQLDGIESILDDEEAPAAEITEAVDKALACEPRLRINALCANLARLSVFRVRAGATDRFEHWDPLTEPFVEFQRRHHGRLALWTEERSSVDRTRLVTWLKRWL